MTVATEPPNTVSLDGLTHSQRLQLLNTWPVIQMRYPDDPEMCLAAYRGAREYLAGELSISGVGIQLATARGHAKLALAVARQVAIMAVADGHHEKDVALKLGVDRMAVRRWIGR